MACRTHVKVKDPSNPVQKIDELEDWINLQWRPPLIVIDSLVRFASGNENETETWKQWWETIARYKAKGVSFLILHHSGKGDTTREGRGSTDITAGSDFKFLFEKMKDGENEFKSLRKMKMKMLRTRYPDPDVLIESTVHISPEGVWTQSATAAQVKATKKVDLSNAERLRDLLKANPGIGVNEFIKIAAEAQIGKRFIITWKDEGLTAGRIVTKEGPRNAKLLSWNHSHVEEPTPEPTFMERLKGLRVDDIDEPPSRQWKA